MEAKTFAHTPYKSNKPVLFCCGNNNFIANTTISICIGTPQCYYEYEYYNTQRNEWGSVVTNSVHAEYKLTYTQNLLKQTASIVKAFIISYSLNEREKAATQ